MRHVPTALGRMLVAVTLALSSFAAGSLPAASIDILPGDLNPFKPPLSLDTLRTNLTQVNPSDGTIGPIPVLNNTGLTLTDFHFEIRGIVLSGPLTGSAVPFFSNAIGTTSTLDFFAGPGDPGIRPGDLFSISGSGLGTGPQTFVAFTPSAVPEPPSLVLGVAGILILLVSGWCWRG